MICGVARDPTLGSNGYWTQALHELPHINSRLHLSPDHYIHKDESYESGVRTLAFIPVEIILILLFILLVKLYLQMKNVAKNDVSSCYCNCSELKCVRCLVKWALILLLLAILIEFIILVVGLMSFKDHLITDAIIDNHQYGKDLDKQVDDNQMAPGMVFNITYAEEDCKDLQDFKKILRNDSVRPYRKLYARFLTELQAAWYDISRPTIPPRVVRTQFQKDLLQYIITRFFLCLLGWAIGILILICRPHRYWIVALVGVIWCCEASWMLMRAAVKVADICEHPDIFVNTFVDHKKLKKQMIQEHYSFCDEYHTFSSRSKPRIRNIYYKWKFIFQKTLDKIRGEYDAGEIQSVYISEEPMTKSDKSAVTDKNKKPRIKQYFNYTLVVTHKTDYRYCYLKRVEEFEEHQMSNYASQLNVKYMKCRGKVLEEDMPVDDIDALCHRDAIIKWLLLQLLLVFLLALLFLAMIAIHFSRQSSIYKYRLLLDNYKAKSKKKMKDTTTWILQEKRAYPPTMPPGECYKSCKQYKKILRAKKYLAGKLGHDDVEPKLKRDPFTKYPLPMTPICAKRRYQTCCDPVELVPLEKKDSAICSQETSRQLTVTSDSFLCED